MTHFRYITLLLTAVSRSVNALRIQTIYFAYDKWHTPGIAFDQ